MILAERGPEGRPVRFDAPLELIRADRADQLAPALALAEAALARGHWLAGAFGYEAGLALEPALAGLMPERTGWPLLHLGVYAGPCEVEAQDGPPPPLPDLGLRPLISQADHAAAIARTLDWIASGDIYQINLTFPLEGHSALPPLALYHALRARQPVGHAAFVDLPGAPALVSLSPEAFFDCDAAGGIRVRPMKGTRPRDADPARDRALAEELRHAVKDRAENLMIVDLMRNDLSRICVPGSVSVPALFSVESYATVHQMVSEVQGRLLPGTGLAALMRALFPCGSVTGAPKIRAMQIIRELEPHPRGAYCGAIGWAAPDGRAAFNVAIRTLHVQPDGQLRLNVGGGIVADSTAAGEWEEALWKSRFARPD